MKHWTEDEFLHWLYAGSLPDSHLEECQECRSRAEQMAETRRQAATPLEVSLEFLAAQRRSIYGRLGSRSTLGRSTLGRSIAGRWAVAVATLLCIVGLSLSMLHPWARGTSALYTSSDEKLFSDLASIEQSSEPRAIGPIHKLFQE